MKDLRRCHIALQQSWGAHENRGSPCDATKVADILAK
jgi:hypothetical protein